MRDQKAQGPASEEWRAKVDRAVREHDFTHAGYAGDGEIEPYIGCLAGIEMCGCNSLYSKYTERGGRDYFHAALSAHQEDR